MIYISFWFILMLSSLYYINLCFVVVVKVLPKQRFPPAVREKISRDLEYMLCCILIKLKTIDGLLNF